MAWTYEQNFDSLNDGSLVGQDGWSKLAGTDTTDVDSSYALLSTTKGLGVPVASSINFSLTRTVSAGTSGTLYFATKCTNVNSTGQNLLAIDDGSYYGVFINWVRVDSTTYKIQSYTNAGYVDTITNLAVGTVYIMAIEYDTVDDQYRMKYKTVGGTFSSWSSFVSFNSPRGSFTRFSLIHDWTWGVVYDEFSASDPDTPVATTFIPQISIF